MTASKTTSREEWLAARLEHLCQEKAFDRQRDTLSAARRELPWLKVEQDYLFDGPHGTVSLRDLFGGSMQLIVYHFMYHPGWEAGGCPSCSLLADHFDGMIAHLRQRDTNLAVVSKARIDQIESYRKRMGWKFNWVSSFSSNFNEDFHVSFTLEEMEKGVTYNYSENVAFPQEEAPGASVFICEDDAIYHTYSTYGRGLDKLIGIYHFLDMTPKGRDEDELPYPMAWIRRHDEYDN